MFAVRRKGADRCVLQFKKKKKQKQNTLIIRKNKLIFVAED